jgi:hypothetical protein
VKKATDWQWLLGGMAGASFVAVTQMATRTDLGTPHFLAIAAYSVTMPISVALALRLRDTPPKKLFSTFKLLLLSLASSGFLLGTDTMLFAIRPGLFLAFFLATCFSLVFVVER